MCNVTFYGEYDRCIHINGLINSRQIDANRESCAIGLESTWIKKFHLSSSGVSCASLVFHESYPAKLLRPGKCTEQYIVIEL